MNVNKSVTAYFAFKTESVNLQGAKSLLDGGGDVLVLDVSSASEYAAGHLLCAKNYVWDSGAGNFYTSITSLNPYQDDDIFLYDQTGAKSAAAATYLAGQGFKSLYYMTDGLDDWMAEGYETFTTAEDGGICTSFPPLAYAGTDQSVNENASVTLRGQGSDPDGGAVTYAWTQAQGSTVTLSSTATSQPVFTAPDLNGGDDKLIFHLTVTDNKGHKDTDSVTVDVNWVNAPPTANAGLYQKVAPGTPVTLDGSGSTDPENAIVSYQWAVVSGTISPALSNASTVSPSFTASAEGWVILELTVTDNGELTGTDTVKITVEQGSTPPNNPLTADAGDNQTVTESDAVTLDSSGSTDSDGTIFSRQWVQTGGAPAVQLSDASATQPTFAAPSVTAAVILTFTLTVIDDKGDTDMDTVTITVNDNGITPPPENKAPTADAGPDQSIKEGTKVTLDGTGSTDSDGTIAGYAWTQTDATGVSVTLSGNSSAKPTFTAPNVDAATTLIFTLTVTDDDGATDTDTVSIAITVSSGGGGGGGCFISSVNE